MTIDKKINGDEKVQVDYPITDGEIFAHILTGEKPKRPIYMSKSEIRAHNWIVGIFLVACLGLATYGLVDHITKEYEGSISKFYHTQMEKLNKAPLNWH